MAEIIMEEITEITTEINITEIVTEIITDIITDITITEDTISGPSIPTIVPATSLMAIIITTTLTTMDINTEIGVGVSR